MDATVEIDPESDGKMEIVLTQVQFLKQGYTGFMMGKYLQLTLTRQPAQKRCL